MGEADRAIGHGERSIELVLNKHAFRFDAEGWLRVDAAVLVATALYAESLWSAYKAGPRGLDFGPPSHPLP